MDELEHQHNRKTDFGLGVCDTRFGAVPIVPKVYSAFVSRDLKDLAQVTTHLYRTLLKDIDLA